MDTGDALFLAANGGGAKSVFRRVPFGSLRFDEKWLQAQIYENINLLKVTDPVYDRVRIVPLCREFTLNDSIRNVFLDILAVTETGRLVLVECKLWKNPQARREVLAQLIEYASLLQYLSYGDLVAKLHRYVGRENGDPIIQRFREAGVEASEPVLIDRIARSLKDGDFQLIIAGDGIRADIQNLAHSKVLGGAKSDISLLEIGIFENDQDGIILIPSVPVRTETLTKTVLVTPTGAPVTIQEDVPEASEVEPSRQMTSETKARNAVFWDKVIEFLKFDHPDQGPARRGGNNWIKVAFLEPFQWITAWRSKDEFGIYLKLSLSNEPEAEKAKAFFSERLDELKSGIDPHVRVETSDDKTGWARGFWIALKVTDTDTANPATEQMQIEWFQDRLNKFVNTIRPLMNQYYAG